MSGKGAKGLLTGKTPASKDKDKDKKKPISRSSRAGLQVSFLSLPFLYPPILPIPSIPELHFIYSV